MEKLDSASRLIEAICNKTCTICVVGLGQVGLPTAISLLKGGYQVIGYDVNESLVQSLLKGSCNIPEAGLSKLVRQFVQETSFRVSSKRNVLSIADVVIVCVATPLSTREARPDMSFLNKAIEEVANELTAEKLIIIESTLPPGSMGEFIIPTLEHLSGKRAGSDFLVSFCPERISPGDSLQEFANNSRIIGANDDTSYIATYSLLKNITRGKINRSDTTTAEISKLAENTYRDINIALANELAIICKESGTDVMDVIRLANTHPRVNIHRPGPGVGGPCLPKDPYFLITKKNSEQSIVRLARQINDSMPAHVVDSLVKTINRSHKNKENIMVAILGAAYKGEVSDTRFSPTEKIIEHLKMRKLNNISVHDPYSHESFGTNYRSDLEGLSAESDCIIVATPHRVYSTLKASNFKKGSIIMDAVSVLDKANFINSGVLYQSL